MNVLMNIKLAIKKFVGKNDVFIMPLFKFLLVFVALSRINSSIGFMTRLTSTPITMIIALAGSFLPLNLMIFIMGLIIVAHMYALALEVAIFVLALFLILFLLYFRFASDDAVGGILTPIGFSMHIPYVMPISMGLKGTPSSVASVGAGVIVYQVIHFISENAESLSGGEEGDILGQFKIIVDAVLGNRNMFVTVVSFAATVLVVYYVRRLPIKYAWICAIVAGDLSLLFVTIFANVALHGDVSLGEVFVGIIVSTIFNLVLCYYAFDLNYNKIEKVQFEDDEYYYYVKAIPKNDSLAEANKKPKKKPISKEAMVRTKPMQSVQRESAKTEPVRTSPERVRTDVDTPVRTVQSRPVDASDDAAAAIRNMTHERNTQSRPVEAARVTPRATKGPLGLSGGRPAGEGRRLREQQDKNKK